MTVTIDGATIEIASTDGCIVDLAVRARVPIPSPCYHSGRKDGCCRVCVVEVDGEQAYACCTAPRDGMQIVVQRDDLVELRAQRLNEYRAGGSVGEPCECDCSCSSGCC